jgi:hypothetical protein
MNENLPFVNNTTNHQNVLQVRLIENLWVVLSQEIYEGAWKATTQQELISRIESQLKNFDRFKKKDNAMLTHFSLGFESQFKKL